MEPLQSVGAWSLAVLSGLGCLCTVYPLAELRRMQRVGFH
jgi:hypothetical protein